MRRSNNKIPESSLKSILLKSYPGNMQVIYRKTLMLKCNINKNVFQFIEITVLPFFSFLKFLFFTVTL